MLKDLLEILRETAKKILGSRIFALALMFTGMFAILIFKLFDLQIVNGEKYLDEYVQLTAKTVDTPGTRGNIYDRNGRLLAYNELARPMYLRNTLHALLSVILLRTLRIFSCFPAFASSTNNSAMA